MDQTVKSILEAWGHVLPELVLLATAGVQFLLAPLLGSARGAAGAGLRHRYAALSLLAVGCALWLWAGTMSSVLPAGLTSPAPSSLLSGPFRLDALAWYLRGLSLATGAVLVLLCWNQFVEEEAGESHACLLLIVAGVNLVAAANDLVVLFLALELVSIPTYVLLFLLRRTAEGHEAVLKYFLLSVFSSALLLYGLSLLYGAAGTTNLETIRVGLSSLAGGALPLMMAVALVAVVAGVGFRVTAVPFHFYAPDVFQGTQTCGAALLSIVPKLAGFAVLLRLVAVRPVTAAAVPLEFDLAGSLSPILWWLAVVTMCVGNVLALWQTNVRRMLAYSSVAHGGYLLVGLAVAHQTGGLAEGVPALLFYLAVYGFMTLGVFAVLIGLSAPDRPVETVEDLAGAGRSRPGAALLMAIFLFSLTGLPPTAGFFGKLYLLLAAWSGGTFAARSLAVLLAVNAAIGAAYYLRLVGALYLRPAGQPVTISTEGPALIGSLICAVVTLTLFLCPQWLWQVVVRMEP